jgi:pimeloyl-ACP methyl ester carboxylesterase
MRIVDVGRSAPVVVLPGVQGRWEWMRPAIDALAEHCRVITFSYADEPTCGGRFDEADGFSSYVEQVAEALDAAGLARATICGVSYGGLVAAAFAARYPDRVDGLVLVSAIPPSWAPDTRIQFYLRSPWLLSPLFCLGSLRMHREIAAAAPGRLRGLLASGRIAARVLTHMFSPPRMARRATLLPPASLAATLATVKAPTLIVTGEPSLDRVVPVAMTHEYLRLLPQAVAVTIPNTGHLGLITKPEEFARVVGEFMAQACGRPHSACTAQSDITRPSIATAQPGITPRPAIERSQRRHVG